MKKFIKKYWLAITLVLVGIGIIYLVFFRPRQEPSPTPFPTPIAFEVVNTYPQEGSHEVVIANLAVEFTFTKEVDLAKTAIRVSPTSNIDISYGDTEKSVVIKPNNQWLMDVNYTFTVTAESKEGDALEEPYVYEIQFTPLTKSDLQEG